MIKRTGVFFLLSVGFVLMGGAAWADSVPVTNASFENTNPLTFLCGAGCAYNYGPIPGWSSSNGGSWEPGNHFTSIPDGSIVGFTNGGSLSQTLTGQTVLPNTFYTLTVFVGNRLDGLNGNYAISLNTILGGVTTNLCSFSGNSAAVAPGTFQAETCTYQSQSNVSAGNLYLLFNSYSGQLDVDKVSVTTPEPGSLLMTCLGLIGIMAFLLRRNPNASHSTS